MTDSKKEFNIFVQSTNGGVEVISFSSGRYFVGNDFFGSMSVNFDSFGGDNNIEIHAKTGEIISLYSQQ